MFPYLHRYNFTCSNIILYIYHICRRSLKLCISVILSGIYDVPQDKVAIAMKEALTECIHKYEKPSTYKKPIEIHLVDINTSMLQHIQSEFKTIRLRPVSQADISAVLHRVLRVPWSRKLILQTPMTHVKCLPDYGMEIQLAGRNRKRMERNR